LRRGLVATQQIIELRHFLPLQVLLLGVYARIFAITSNTVKAYGLNLDEMLNGERTRRHDFSPTAIVDQDPRGFTPDGPDLGEKLPRITTPSQTISHSNQQLFLAPKASTLPIPEPSSAKEYVTVAAGPSRKAKGKKSAIDDIFGL
jgi:hypothetical protein